jgi:hypothetical protein
MRVEELKIAKANTPMSIRTKPVISLPVSRQIAPVMMNEMSNVPVMNK